MPTRNTARTFRRALVALAALASVGCTVVVYHEPRPRSPSPAASAGKPPPRTPTASTGSTGSTRGGPMITADPDVDGGR